jgi:hypothetical protein
VSLNRVADKNLIDAVRDNMSLNQFDQAFKKLSESLDNCKCFLVGGSVRDPIINKLYGQKITSNDFDIIVDDTLSPLNSPRFAKNLGGPITMNRFGGLKWLPIPQLEIDISSLSSLPSRPGFDPSEGLLHFWLKTSNFDTGSIVFDTKDNLIWDYKAMDAIKCRKIELMNLNEDPIIAITRLALQSHKLGFSLGPRATALVQNTYSMKTYKKIQDFLIYKNRISDYDLVLSKLDTFLNAA